MEVLYLVTRLSARYGRVLAEPTMTVCARIYDCCCVGNSFYPSDEERLRKRKDFFIEARGLLDALDTRIALIYDVLRDNPQGAFTNCDGKTLPPAEASRKINKKVERIGRIIIKEKELLSKRIKNDRVK